MLKIYFTVKTVSKGFDDYDHIKMITEQDPLQVELRSLFCLKIKKRKEKYPFT
jgi:hypothetical protein